MLKIYVFELSMRRGRRKNFFAVSGHDWNEQLSWAEKKTIIKCQPSQWRKKMYCVASGSLWLELNWHARIQIKTNDNDNERKRKMERVFLGTTEIIRWCYGQWSVSNERLMDFCFGKVCKMLNRKKLNGTVKSLEPK